MKDGEYVRSEIKEIIFYLFTGVFLAIVIPLGIGLALRGFEESFVSGQALTFGSYLTSFLTYMPFLIVSLFCIIFPIASLVSIKRNETAVTQKNPSWFRIFTVSEIYSPEKYGLLYYLSEQLGFKGKNNFMRWSLNPLRVIIVSILIFGVYGIFLVANPQLSVSGVPQLQLQQVTLASEVAFQSFVPAFSENGLLFFVFMFLMGIDAYICAKFFKGSIPIFFAIGFLICVLMGFFWGFLHIIVYGNSDASFFATVIFGFLGSLITLLTGIFIFWFIWHIMNNAMITLSEATAVKEDLILIFGIILFIIFVLWVGVELLLRSRRKKQSMLSIPGN
jgi:hypothetical protein